MTEYWREIPEFLYTSEILECLRENKLNRHFHQQLAKKTDFKTIEYCINRAYLLCIVFMMDNDPLDDVFKYYIKFEGICDLSIACTLLRGYKMTHPECDKPIDEFIEDVSNYIDLWDFSVDYKKYWRECEQLDFAPHPISPKELNINYGMRNRMVFATHRYHPDYVHEIVGLYRLKSEKKEILKILEESFDADSKKDPDFEMNTDKEFWGILSREIDESHYPSESNNCDSMNNKTKSNSIKILVDEMIKEDSNPIIYKKDNGEVGINIENKIVDYFFNNIFWDYELSCADVFGNECYPFDKSKKIENISLLLTQLHKGLNPNTEKNEFADWLFARTIFVTHIAYFCETFDNQSFMLVELRRHSSIKSRSIEYEEGYEWAVKFIHSLNDYFIEIGLLINKNNLKQLNPVLNNPTSENNKVSDQKVLPNILATPQAMKYWEILQNEGLIDEHYQPKCSRPKMVVIAYEMSKRLNIENMWKVFEPFWGKKRLATDYYQAKEKMWYEDFVSRIRILLSD